MEHSSKWNTHIIIKMELIKMEHSYYYQNGTHQNGTLILLSKWNSSKWNTHIIIKMELIKMEHSYYYQNGTHQNGTLSRLGRAPHPPILYTRRAPFGFVPSGLGFRSNGTLLISKPWIIVKSLGSSFNDLLKTIKTFFNNIIVSFSLTQGVTPAARLGLWTLRPRFSAV